MPNELTSFIKPGKMQSLPFVLNRMTPAVQGYSLKECAVKSKNFKPSFSALKNFAMFLLHLQQFMGAKVCFFSDCMVVCYCGKQRRFRLPHQLYFIEDNLVP